MLMMKSSTQSLILMETKRQALAQGFFVMYIPFIIVHDCSGGRCPICETRFIYVGVGGYGNDYDERVPRILGGSQFLLATVSYITICIVK